MCETVGKVSENNRIGKALGVDPRSWMEDVLLRITACGNDRAALRELLPDRWEKESK